MLALGAVSGRASGVHGYTITGDGPLAPMVLLHGIGASAQSWALVMRHLLRDSRRVYMPDLPGHGFSRAPDRLTLDGVFHDLDKALCGEISAPVVLVGHSLGALMAIRFALRHPERVRGLVLITPAGATVADGAWDEVKPRLDIRTNADGRSLVDRMLAEPSWYSAWLAPYIRETYSRPSVRAIVDSVCVGDMLSAAELGRVRAPTMVLWGGKDRLLPRSDLDHFRTSLSPLAEIVEVEGWGHGPVLDRSADVARRVVEFAGRQGTRGA
jgi:pimeloyl-ACP methyl ester carboxylesterase